MSHPYTDARGFPLTAAQALARMNNPRSSGYYDANGRWVKVHRTAKRAPPTKEPKEKKDA